MQRFDLAEPRGCWTAHSGCGRDTLVRAFQLIKAAGKLKGDQSVFELAKDPGLW